MKKVLLCSLCLLVCALGINIPAVGQPSQKLVNVVVSPDRPDWKYKVGDEAVFTVQVLEAANPVKGVTVDYEVGPEFFPTVKKEGVVLKDGKMTLKAKMTEPGFARCRVVAVGAGCRCPRTPGFQSRGQHHYFADRDSRRTCGYA